MPLPAGVFPERIETERLILLRPRPVDIAACDRVFAAARPELREKGVSIAFGAFMVEHWERYGFGFLIALERTTGDTAGHCGLKYLGAFPGQFPETVGGIEVGYSLLPACRKAGYATEAARAVLAAAFRAFDVDRIYGRCADANLASAAVLMRCGMTEVERLGPMRTFEVPRP